jgi:hypothetical protein
MRSVISGREQEMRYSRWSGVPCLMALAMLVGALFVRFGDGDGGGRPKVIVISDFGGSWAAESYEVTSAANPQVSLEAVGVGASFSLDLDETGEFLGDAFIPAAIAGQDIAITDSPGFFYLVTQDTVEVNLTPEVPPLLTRFRGAFTLAGDNMSLIDTNATFDFDGDRVEEAAIFEGTMVRTTP